MVRFGQLSVTLSNGWCAKNPVGNLYTLFVQPYMVVFRLV